MRWLRNALSLRARITLSFTLIVVGGTVVSTLIGSRIITNALLEQARTRVAQGLEAARTIYHDRLAELRDGLARAAADDLHSAVRTSSDRAIAAALETAGGAHSFTGYMDARSGVVLYAGRPDRARLPGGLVRQVGVALSGTPVASTEALDEATLAAIDPALAAAARVSVRDDGAANREVRAGLVQFAAVPVRVDGVVAGALFAGNLRNRQHEVVDRVGQLLYGAETYRGRQVGTIAIVLADVCVSTNARLPSGERAEGMSLPADLVAAVAAGSRWSGRAFVAGEWYEASAEPLRNWSGDVVGALYVGSLEAPFLAARTDVMLTFLVVCLVGLVIVFVLTYLLTRTMIHPLEDMVAATKRIAAGDLDVTVRVAARDEIGELAVAFNHMLRSLKAMNSELQEWGHTLEEKVRERSDELVAVQERMARSEKLASVGRLAAGVAHGINNPLGGILSLSMLALEDMPAEHPLRDDMETIVAQTLRCREIVKGLLDFSRQSEARAVPTDINPVVESTLALLGRQAIFDNIRTTRRLAADLPAVLIDPGQLQEVVTNLVLNSVDAMDEAGELTVETALVEEARQVVIRIADTGKGIPPEAMPLLFEPFFTTKKVGKGTGLGLAIAHGIVSRAGGRIEVTSEPGRTVFTIRLPQVAEGQDDGGAEAAGRRAGEPAFR